MAESDDFPFESTQQDDAPSPAPLSHTKPQTTAPRLTKSMNPKYFKKLVMGTACQAQKEQPFGKDNLQQVFTTERAFPHVVFPILKQGFLDSDDKSNLFAAMPSSQKLWNKYN
jgi:hypothetical protein